MANSRDIQAQMTRQKIIDCMYELLRTKEYNSIRITDIAKKANAISIPRLILPQLWSMNGMRS